MNPYAGASGYGAASSEAGTRASAQAGCAGDSARTPVGNASTAGGGHGGTATQPCRGAAGTCTDSQEVAGAGGATVSLQTAGAGGVLNSIGLPAGNGGYSGAPAPACVPASIDGVPTLAATIGVHFGICSEPEVVELLAETLSTRAQFSLMALDENADYAARAARLLSPGWVLRDHAPLALIPPLDWGSDQGDRNWHFTLNSLTPAVPFLADSIVGGSEDSLNHMKELVLDWIRFNMVRNEPNAMKSFNQAVGYRAHYMSVLLREVLARQPSDVESIRSIVWALLEHGRWLADPENRTTSNHWLYMMLGLKSAHAVLPDMAETYPWGQYATDGILSYADERVSSEGISLEHSPQYQWYVTHSLEMFTGTALFGQALQARTDQMLSQLVWMVNPSGPYVGIGDSGEKNYELGSSPAGDFAATDGVSGTEPPEAPVGFADAGIAVLRSPWSEHPFGDHAFLYFLAAFHSTIHKHADHFTFEWNDLGVPIIVDSGKFSYDSSALKTFFNSTRASNTVEIDGKDYSLSPACVFGSALTGWGKTRSGLQYVAGHLDHCDSNVSHDRVIVLRPHGWLLVTDWLNDETAAHQYRQWFGFHETAELVSLGAGSVLMRLGNAEELHVQALGDVTSLEHARGREEPDYQGWISHEYNVRVPRDSVAFVSTGNHVVLSALMTLSAAAENVQFDASPDGVALQFERGSGDPETLVLRGGSEPIVADGQ